MYGSQVVREDDRLEYLVEDDIEIVLCNGVPMLIRIGGRWVPHLKMLLKEPDRFHIPKIIVDEGAVKPIARGADLMRPGIVRVEGEFAAGDVVVVCEPTRALPLAVHEALYSLEEVMKMEKGRVTKRLHHLGDRYWKLV